jgi:hypothetical protein
VLVRTLLLSLLVAVDVLKVGAGKGIGRPRLKRAAEKQLRREERGELHVEGSAGSGHIGAIRRGLLVVLVLVLMLVLVLKRLRVDRRDVPAARMSVGKARDVGGEGTVGEARVAIRRLRGVAEAAGGARPGVVTHVLHPEKMRRDEVVPSDVR